MNINKVDYIYVDSDEKLIQCLKYINESNILGVDTETTGLDPINDNVRLLQIAAIDKPVAVIDITQISSESMELLKQVFSSSSVKVFQNAKFDLKFLKRLGFKFSGAIFDTMIAAQITADKTGPYSFGLDTLAAFYLGINLPKDEQKSNWGVKLTTEQIEYAARDAAILLPLRERLIKDIKRFNLIEVCKLEFDCIWAVVDMELSGMRIDVDKWNILTEKHIKEQGNLTFKLNRELGSGGVQMSLFGEEKSIELNLDSQSQVLKALKNKGIELKSTSQAELMEYKDRHEVIKWLLEYRKVSKAISGFLTPIPEYINKTSGRIHSSYRQIGAGSGRFSCGNPNIQQIPRGKEFRECFVPEAGNKFVIADYSQIELRVAAEIAKDKTMIEAYKNGQDLHSLTAALIANKRIDNVTKQERQAAKAVNFGLIYAMGAKGLQGYAKTVYGIDMSLEEAEVFRDRFFNAYTGIANWHSAMKKQTGVTESRTLSGRRCIFGTEALLTTLLNTPVQGTAADIAKKALGMLVPVVEQLDGHIVATVHDEILLEVPENMAKKAVVELKNVMEMAGGYYLKHLPVIAETTIADSWAEK